MPPVRRSGRRLSSSLQEQIAGAGGRRLPDDDHELQLPDGINVEEARRAVNAANCILHICQMHNLLPHAFAAEGCDMHRMDL